MKRIFEKQLALLDALGTAHQVVLSMHRLPNETQSSPSSALMEASMDHQSSLVRDPVCGMEIDSKTAAATTTYQGKTFYFCRVECKEQFVRSPERFTKAA
jgi:P-type Cu+ transporter